MVEPEGAAVGARRAEPQRRRIVVGQRWKPFGDRAARTGLAVDVADHLLPEGAVVEPVVALPPVDHGVDRYARLQRRMWVHQAHHRGKAVIAGAEGGYAAVGLRDVPHQPVDRVPGVGRMVDRSRVERPAQGPVHDVIAFRAELAAHVLDREDVAGPDQLGVKRREDGFRLGSAWSEAGPFVRRIGCAIEHDRQLAGHSGDDQHRVELHPVAHRDENPAALVGRSGESRRDGREDERDGGRMRRDVAAMLNRWLHLRGGGERHRQGEHCNPF